MGQLVLSFKPVAGEVKYVSISNVVLSFYGMSQCQPQAYCENFFGVSKSCLVSKSVEWDKAYLMNFFLNERKINFLHVLIDYGCKVWVQGSSAGPRLCKAFRTGWLAVGQSGNLWSHRNKCLQAAGLRAELKDAGPIKLSTAFVRLLCEQCDIRYFLHLQGVSERMFFFNCL